MQMRGITPELELQALLKMHADLSNGQFWGTPLGYSDVNARAYIQLTLTHTLFHSCFFP